jgi:serine protease Do
MLPPEGLPFEVEGALIQEVIPGTPADEAGLEAGDIIVAIDSTPIDHHHALPDVIGQYEPDDRITIHLWRENKKQSVRVKLAARPEDPTQAYLGIYFQTITAPDLDQPGG